MRCKGTNNPTDGKISVGFIRITKSTFHKSYLFESGKLAV